MKTKRKAVLGRAHTLQRQARTLSLVAVFFAGTILFAQDGDNAGTKTSFENGSPGDGLLNQPTKWLFE